MTEGVQSAKARYGGFWIRLVAYFIDSIILWVFFYIVSFLLFFLVGEGEEAVLSMQHLDPGQVSNRALADPFYMVAGLFSCVMPWLYFTLFESSRYQGTLGKRALGLKVVDAKGQRIGFGKANVRFWSKILSALILYIGFLMIGWTRYKQGLHDKIAGTFVIRAS